MERGSPKTCNSKIIAADYNFDLAKDANGDVITSEQLCDYDHAAIINSPVKARLEHEESVPARHKSPAMRKTMLFEDVIETNVNIF